MTKRDRKKYTLEAQNQMLARRTEIIINQREEIENRDKTIEAQREEIEIRDKIIEAQCDAIEIRDKIIDRKNENECLLQLILAVTLVLFLDYMFPPSSLYSSGTFWTGIIIMGYAFIPQGKRFIERFSKRKKND